MGEVLSEGGRLWGWERRFDVYTIMHSTTLVGFSP